MTTIKQPHPRLSAGSSRLGAGHRRLNLPVKAQAVEYVEEALLSLYGVRFLPSHSGHRYLQSSWVFSCAPRRDHHGALLRRPRFYNGEGGIRGFVLCQLLQRIGSRHALTIDYPHRTELRLRPTFGQGPTSAFSNLRATQQHRHRGELQPPGGNRRSRHNDQVFGSASPRSELLFIRFAGFTFGKSASASSTPWHAIRGSNHTSFPRSAATTRFHRLSTTGPLYLGQFRKRRVGALGPIDDSSANQFNRTQIINAIGRQRRHRPASRPRPPSGGNVRLFSGAASGVFTNRCRLAYGGHFPVPDFVGNIRSIRLGVCSQSRAGGSMTTTPGLLPECQRCPGTTFK